MVNGRSYDWESITVTMPHGMVIDFSSITYKDSKEIRPVYGKGSMARRYGRGNYDGDVDVTMLREEFDLLCKAAAAQGVVAFYRMQPIEIVVSYSLVPEGPVVTDVLHQVVWTSRDAGAEQGAEKIEVKLTGKILGGITMGNYPAEMNTP